MQVLADTLTLLTLTKTGVVGREKITYTRGQEIIGTIHPLSREDYIKRYSDNNFKDNGAFTLQTLSPLYIGNYLEFNNKRYKVIGFIKGRVRNSADLIEVTHD